MRIELLHPMVVGFPISLLFIGAVLRFVAFCAHKHSASTIVLMIAQYLIGGGILLGMVAIFTGDLAHTKVHPNICDHSVLDQHQMYAFTAISFFTIGLLADRSSHWFQALRVLAAACYCVGLASLINTGHLGGTLVFTQGVGVEKLCTGKNKAPFPEHIGDK